MFPLITWLHQNQRESHKFYNPMDYSQELEEFFMTNFPNLLEVPAIFNNGLAVKH